MLTGLNQNGVQSDVPFHEWEHMDRMTAGGEAEPNPHCLTRRNVSSPYSSGVAGKLTAREADGNAGKG